MSDDLEGRFRFIADMEFNRRARERERLTPTQQLHLDNRVLEGAAAGRVVGMLIPALRDGGDPNVRDKEHDATALMWATLNNKIDAIVELLRCRADPMLDNNNVIRGFDVVKITPDNPRQDRDVPMAPPLMAILGQSVPAVIAFTQANVEILAAWHPVYMRYSAFADRVLAQQGAKFKMTPHVERWLNAEPSPG